MIDIIEHGDIREIHLNRPPVNALNLELLTALLEAVQAAPADGKRGIILSGGQNAFSGGLDVPYLMSLDRAGLSACWLQFFNAARALARSPIPVVAAIAGHNPAGGCVLALCCDYRVMARGPFRIGLNETQVGLTVPEAIQYLMRRIVGAQRCERLVVAGAMVDSEQALALGLVDELAEPGEVVERGRLWLGQLLTLPWTPMLATRRIARADIVHALDGFAEAQMQTFLEGWYSPDSQTALQAVLARLRK